MRTLRCALALALLAGTAPAQQLLETHVFDGWSFTNPVVDLVGDANGDGRPDLVIGDANSGTYCFIGLSYYNPGPGHYRVVSLEDGASLVPQDTWCPKQEGAWVSAAGDWDRDGHDDYVVLSAMPTYCEVVVRSGLDGKKLQCLQPAPSLFPGTTIARVGDVDGDGDDELVMGVPDEGVLGTVGGAALLLDGSTGAVRLIIPGEEPGDKFGGRVARAGDIDLDGAPDFAVVAWVVDPAKPNYVRVHSGRSGGLLLRVEGDLPVPAVPTGLTYDGFGTSIAPAGDADGDGTPDIVVGLVEALSPAGLGQVRVYSGRDGSVLMGAGPTIVGSKFARSVSPLGDINFDGHDDILVAEPHTGGLFGEPDLGRVHAISGRNGSILFTVFQTAPVDDFGMAVGATGDFDGDGFLDFHVVGKQRAYVYSSRIELQLPPLVPLHVAGAATGEGFGSAVAGVTDLDGDLRADLVVGAPLAPDGLSAVGSVRAFSGLTGAPVWARDGDAPGQEWGSVIACSGDVDGDGRDDVLVGAPLDATAGAEAGLARLLSGANGSLLWEATGAAPGDRHGAALAGPGDVDGDGTPDFAVGAPGHDAGGPDAGATFVHSGADGSLLYRVDGTSPGASSGQALAPAGDWDADGTPDLFVGAPLDAFPDGKLGSVRVLSGADGAEMLVVPGQSKNGRFGQVVTGAGDVDGDGVPDFGVGAPNYKVPGVFDPYPGTVQVRSGAAGAVLFTVKSGAVMEGLGGSVAVGDTDGDGQRDVMYGGEDGAGRGMVRVHRLLDGLLLATYKADDPQTGLGSALAAVDLDGDGISSPVLAEPFGSFEHAPAAMTGHVTAFYSLQSWVPLAGGLPGKVGVPGLSGTGKLGEGSPVTVTLVNAAPAAIGRLVVGLGVAGEPFGGAALIPTPDVVLGFVTSPGGGMTWTGGWPAVALSGTKLYLQAWVLDAASFSGYSASNGLMVTTP